MRNPLRWTLLTVLFVAVCAVALDFSPIASSQGPRKGVTPKGKTPVVTRQPALENFDIRMQSPDGKGDGKGSPKQTGEADTGLVLEQPKPRLATQSQREAAVAIEQAMNAAQAGLAARVPGLKVDYNETLHVPEIVGIDGGGTLGTAGPVPAAVNDAKEVLLRNFVTENAALYGLTQTQAERLTTVADYTNPAGNLSFVELQQELNGIPVFQGFIRGTLNRDGQLVRTNSLLAAGLRASSLRTSPQLSATQAVALAAAKINVAVDADSLSVVERDDSEHVQVVSAGPLSHNTKTELVYFPLTPGHAVLAYSMVLWQPDYGYYVVVDAETGALLWRKNLTQDQTQTVTYNIYNDDSPTPLSPTTFTAPTTTQPPGITRTDVTLISENAADSLGWIGNTAPGFNATTTGNNVDAGLDIFSPDGIDSPSDATPHPDGHAVAAGRVFSFPYKPDGSTDPTGSNDPTDTNYRMGVVTNLFFWTNRYHDRLYDLGFTEAARNFQEDNFGRGGNGNDPISAQAQDFSGTNNANFLTPPDGTPGRMQMYIFTTTPRRDGDIDQEVSVHEMTHGTSNRLHANASGLFSAQAAGMGEGWSDFYALSLLSTNPPADTNGNGIYAFGAYVTKNYYYGIRRFPYAVKSNVGANGKPHNPETFADIDPAQINLSDGANPPAFTGSANEVHNAGEIWCTMLMEVRAKLIAQYGFATGNQRALQVVTDGMKLDPVNPTFVQARDAILAADCASFGGADELNIWDGFRIRGAGFRASTDGLNVVENFEGPNLRLNSVTAAEASGSNGNGVFDPGETVTLTLPLTNILCATPATGTTATLSPSGNSANYGTIAPGGSDSRTIDFTIPTNTACGSAIAFTITVNSSLGPINYTYNLPVGQAGPLSSFENFDGVTAPNLPNGWTTTHSGAGLGWVTSTTNPDTAPNDAFTGDQPNTGTNSLISPAFPVNTALAQVSFRNLYNLEDGFDAETMEIKIDNGAFQDIIKAGGSFVSGGYNSPIGWSGLSGGTTASPTYITSVVNLPPAASGHNVRLRWTVRSDPNTIAPGQAGARIDTIQLSTSAAPCSPVGVSTVSLSGQVTDGVNGVNGIQITLSGTTTATTTTSGNGNYSFPNIVSGGNYTVTPTTPGFEYTPPSRTYNNLTTNVTDANFTAVPAPGISGRVTTQNGAQGIDGITMTLSGTQSATTTTAGGGFYSFSPLTRGGNYTVTPSGGNNNTFSPASRTYNNLQGPVTDANFVAIENLNCPTAMSPVSGSIASTDPTQTNRITRNGVPSDCNGKAFPGKQDAVGSELPRHYDQYTFTNTSGAPQCVQVTLNANNAGVHSVAYLGSFNPADISQNYIGDLGITYTANTNASYSFNVPAGATYVVVVHETTSNGPAFNYTLGFGCGAPAGQPAAPLAQPGQVLITEFRLSGPGTSGTGNTSDEFVELYNNTDAPISVSGYGIALFNASFGGDVVLGFPAGIVIPRRGHLLVVNTVGYSLGGYAGADLSHSNTNLMADNQGFGLIDNTRSVLIDSVGFVGNGGNLPYIEGTGLRPTTSRPAVQYAYVRRTSTANSFPIDTDNNANDFVLVSVTAAAFPASPTPVQSVLGAPGPENRTSPVERSVFNTPGLVDPTASPTGGENRKRILCGDPGAPACDPSTSQFGFLSLRRKVTNVSGTNVTRLRFRIIDVTTLGSPGAGAGQADLRALTSSAITVTINGTPTTIQGTTVETPPTQALGGGLNTSMSVNTITLGTPLPPNQSVNVQFLLGVQQSGSFRFFVTVEALP